MRSRDSVSEKYFGVLTKRPRNMARGWQRTEARSRKTTFSKTALGLRLWCAGAPAQIITTVAGTDFVFPRTPLPAVNAPLGNTQGVAVDPQGNVYAADYQNDRVVQISPNGVRLHVRMGHSSREESLLHIGSLPAPPPSAASLGTAPAAATSARHSQGRRNGSPQWSWKSR